MLLSISSIIDHLPQARDAAIKATDDVFWHTAIEKAYSWLVEQDILDYNISTGELTMVSPDSGKTYHTNGICQCAAYRNGRMYHGVPAPCYHRACARLIRRALEHRQAQQRQTLVDRLAAARRERAYSDIAECF